MLNKYSDKIIKERLKETIGSSMFNSIVDFFRIIAESNYDIKIFVSKKAYVLFLEFKTYIESENESCIYCNDSAIPILDTLYINQSQKSKSDIKIAVIDDILIHGRTLSKIYKKLKKLNYTVDLFAFCKNMDEDFSTNGTDKNKELIEELYEIKKITRTYYICDNFEWKYISNRIIRSFWAINMPYISFLPYLQLTDKGHKKLIKFMDSHFETKSFINHSQKELGQNSIYYYTHSSISTTNGIEGIPLFVLQTQESLQSYNLLSFTFLSEDVLINNGEEILDDLFDIKTKFPLILKRSNIPSKRELILKFSMSIFSLINFKMIIDQCGLSKKDYNINWDNILYSFGAEVQSFMEVLLNNDKDYSEFYQKSSFAFSKTNIDRKNQELENELDKAIQMVNQLTNEGSSISDCEYLKNIYARYLKKNGELDDKAIGSIRERIPGFKFLDLTTVSHKKTNKSTKDIIISLMNQYFIGAANLVMQSGNTGYGLYYHSGEQSYKCVIKEFVPLVYFSDLFRRRLEKTYADFLFEILLDFTEENYKYYNVPFLREDLSQYSSLANENIYTHQDIMNYEKEAKIKNICLIGYYLNDYLFYLAENKNVILNSIQANKSFAKIQFIQDFKEYVIKRDNLESQTQDEIVMMLSNL